MVLWWVLVLVVSTGAHKCCRPPYVPDSGEPNTLEAWTRAYKKGPGVSKWLHYFHFYHRHFQHLVGRNRVSAVEVGVQSGGSLLLWRNYFGDGLRVVGVDINPNCKKFSNPPEVSIRIGHQGDRNFWASWIGKVEVDLFIDDGSHKGSDQIVTMEKVWPSIVPGGVYLCEDLHTSYLPYGFRGGIKREGTFIEYSKDIAGQVVAPATDATGNPLEHDGIDNVHVYDSIMVVDKPDPGCTCIHPLSKLAKDISESAAEALHRHLHWYRRSEAESVKVVVIGGSSTVPGELAHYLPRASLRYYGDESDLDACSGRISCESLSLASSALRSSENATLDVIVDHTGDVAAQGPRLESLWALLRNQGIYVMLLPPNPKGELTGLEVAKDLMDHLHRWCCRRKSVCHKYQMNLTRFTYTTQGIHVYRRAIVVERADRIHPKTIDAGDIWLNPKWWKRTA